MKTTALPEKPDAKSPAAADIRYIIDGTTRDMIHSTVLPWAGTSEAAIIDGPWEPTD